MKLIDKYGITHEFNDMICTVCGETYEFVWNCMMTPKQQWGTIINDLD